MMLLHSKSPSTKTLKNISSKTKVTQILFFSILSLNLFIAGTYQQSSSSQDKRVVNQTTQVQCGIGRYYNSTLNTCKPCHSSCETCSGPFKGDCLSCKLRMYYVKTERNGTMCVANCESVGLFYDARDNTCVGCHPACESCFGPENEECYECSDGYLLMGGNTCDTQCYPENSYLINETICEPCDKYCKSCFGPNITDCTSCYPPYSLDGTECFFNQTLAEIVSKKYVRPTSIWVKISLGLLSMISIVLAYILYKVGRKAWLKYQAGKDRSYNVFDKAEFSKDELKVLKQWKFIVPEQQQNLVSSEFREDGNDYDIVVEFKNFNQEEGNIQLVLSAVAIPPVLAFRYFEVEVLDNKTNSSIYFGIIEENEPLQQTIHHIDDLQQSRAIVLVNGLDGSYWYFTLQKKIAKSLFLKEYGDSVGICLHYQNNMEILEELADAEIERLQSLGKPTKRKKEEFMQDFQKKIGEGDQLRVLIFHDGLCCSSVDQMDKNKIKLDRNKRYKLFVGANGPCKISVNVGGKLFRAHHDELNKGLIDAEDDKTLSIELEKKSNTRTI